MIEFLLFCIGFVGTFIGTMAGGGGLVSLPAMLLLGIPIHTAIASNKFSNVFSSFSSFIILLREKQINIKGALMIAPFSLLGGISGGLIASYLSEQIMTIIAIILLSFALILNMLKSLPEEKTHRNIPYKVYPYLYGIGVYDGMFGPGQGTLLMHTFLRHGFSYLSAIAFSRFQTFLSCFGAISMYLLSGHFQLQYALWLTLGSVLGAQVSIRVAKKLKKSYLTMILRIVTLLLILQLIIRIL
ncbi:sulfite exporter TauE/SafE family protein [Bacillus sp. PS06]|uniref:sulfite exporter TauE/SafE family protein n=1 Tax=Bacillus sp. PS06 TaxID=2764176 RepID=UPI00178422E9|nr:sulfite exporter TauE/SafE family protein [Bacillus sp. PS06]MBD8068477.1 sulfite exporter TauE/SafE family protein [Bacillus sp. PS06]